MKCIKELLLQVVPMEGEDGELMPSLHTQQDIEKFAELIVRECITKAEQEEDRFFEMGEVDLAYAMKNFQNLLKQDFGVEE